MPASWATKTSPGLAAIWLGGNTGLNGSIPSAWAAMSSLKHLQLQWTSVAGTVPGAAGTDWPQLQHVNLDHSKLTAGAVPLQLLAQASMVFFSMRNTSRTGRIGWPTGGEWGGGLLARSCWLPGAAVGGSCSQASTTALP